MHTVILYWSFRSPYSYILLPRINDLTRRYNVEIDLRVIHPGAIRNPTYFARMDPLARPYFLKDSERAAAFHGMPFRRPIPDPITQDAKTLEIAKDQPLARRLGHLGIAATERGKGLPFATQVANLLWDGSTTNWHQGKHLEEATARAGLNLADLEAAITANPHHHESRLTENHNALRAAGHWGAPVMVYNTEPFFGQDRFDVLVWRLNQSNLKARRLD